MPRKAQASHPPAAPSGLSKPPTASTSRLSTPLTPPAAPSGLSALPDPAPRTSRLPVSEALAAYPGPPKASRSWSSKADPGSSHPKDAAPWADPLDALASADKKARVEALETLYEEAWEDLEGSPAILQRLPDLLARLKAKRFVEVEEIFFFLSYLLTQGQGPSILPMPPRETASSLTIRKLLASEAGAFRGFLSSPLPEVRLSAACFFSCLHDPGIPSEAWLFQAFQEESEIPIQAGYLLALGLWLAERPLTLSERTAFWSVFQDALAAEGKPILRLAAAISLLRWFPEMPPQGAILTLLQTMVLPEVSDQYAAFPWSENDVVGDCSRLLSSLPPSFAPTFLDPLRHVLPLVDPYSALQVVRALLSLTQAESGQSSTPERIASLDAIVLSETPWILQQGIREVLADFGLPSQRPALRAFLRHLQTVSSEGTITPK